MQHFQLLVQLLFLPSLASRVPVLFMSSPSSTESLCFIKPTHETYLDNERWGEVTWRFWWAQVTATKWHIDTLLQNVVVSACDSKNLSSHFVTMRESVKDKTNMLRVAERKDQSNAGPWGCQALLNNHPETASCQESLSEKTTHLPLKTVQPGFPVTHS